MEEDGLPSERPVLDVGAGLSVVEEDVGRVGEFGWELERMLLVTSSRAATAATAAEVVVVVVGRVSGAAVLSGVSGGVAAAGAAAAATAAGIAFPLPCLSLRTWLCLRAKRCEGRRSNCTVRRALG